ncbi:hypothetical protein [Sphingobium sp. ZW T5_29]|uniref:hypothetical protein n=1 Tax=Sphingobium sp. ZW T5_29 TaxID=3378077 RepID=UPI003854FC2D
MMLILALAAGCRDSSSEDAPADNGLTPVADVAANVVDTAPPVDIASAPVRPSPKVTVRAHPAPLESLDLPPSPDAAQLTAFPDEVTSFMVVRDSCDHFRGEEPYDGERRVFLAESVARLCTGTDAQLAMLRRRYAGDPSVVYALRGYEDRIESVRRN